MCQCSVFLKSVRIFDSDVTSSFAGSGGVPGESGVKSIPAASICKCVGLMLVILILQTLKRGGR